MANDSISRVMEAAASGIDMIVYLRKFSVISIIEINGSAGSSPCYKYIYERKEH
jgi:hypothetical protein